MGFPLNTETVIVLSFAILGTVIGFLRELKQKKTSLHRISKLEKVRKVIGWIVLIMWVPLSLEILEVPFLNLSLSDEPPIWFSLLLLSVIYLVIELQLISQKKILKVWISRISFIVLTPVLIIVLALTDPLSFKKKPIPKLYGESDLIHAIYFEDMKRVLSLVRKKSELNKVSNTGFTPLMAAAHMGKEKYFDLLAEMGASQNGKITRPFFKRHKDADIFLLAVDGRNPNIVKKLITPEIAKKKYDGYPILLLAVSQCVPKIIDLLIESGADINGISKKGMPVLGAAYQSGCDYAVKALETKGASPVSEKIMASIKKRIVR